MICLISTKVLFHPRGSCQSAAKPNNILPLLMRLGCEKQLLVPFFLPVNKHPNDKSSEKRALFICLLASKIEQWSTLFSSTFSRAFLRTPAIVGIKNFWEFGKFPHLQSFQQLRTNWPLCAVMELLSRLIWLGTWWVEEPWEMLAGNYRRLLLISEKKFSSKNL